MNTFDIESFAVTALGWIDAQNAQVAIFRGGCGQRKVVSQGSAYGNGTIPASTIETESAEVDGVNDTTPDFLEHFEFDVAQLGRNKDRYTDSFGAQFRVSLARRITNDYPGTWDRRMRAVVDHCRIRPNQDKIADGADVLAKTGHLFLEFVEQHDEVSAEERVESWPDECWLYTSAISELDNPEFRQRAGRLLQKWLKDRDSEVREMAANALGSFENPQSLKLLRDALIHEQSPGVCEAIGYAIEACEGNG